MMLLLQHEPLATTSGFLSTGWMSALVGSRQLTSQANPNSPETESTGNRVNRDSFLDEDWNSAYPIRIDQLCK
jgi:hypothetical protein